MTAFVFLRTLQVICALSWLVPVALRFGSVRRVIGGRARGDDPIWMVLWFTGACQVCGSLRWLFYGDVARLMGSAEIVLWAGIYVFSSLCALGAYVVIRLTGMARDA